MSGIGRRGIHYLQNLKGAKVPTELIEKGQNPVIDASLTLIRERAKLKVYRSPFNFAPKRLFSPLFQLLDHYTYTYSIERASVKIILSDT